MVLRIGHKTFYRSDEIGTGRRDGRDFCQRTAAFRDENAIHWQAFQQLQTLFAKITDVQRLHILSAQNFVQFRKTHKSAVTCSSGIVVRKPGLWRRAKLRIC